MKREKEKEWRNWQERNRHLKKIKSCKEANLEGITRKVNLQEKVRAIETFEEFRIWRINGEDWRPRIRGKTGLAFNVHLPNYMLKANAQNIFMSMLFASSAKIKSQIHRIIWIDTCFYFHEPLPRAFTGRLTTFSTLISLSPVNKYLFVNKYVCVCVCVVMGNHVAFNVLFCWLI